MSKDIVLGLSLDIVNDEYVKGSPKEDILPLFRDIVEYIESTCQFERLKVVTTSGVEAKFNRRGVF